MADKHVCLRSPGRRYSCWGYYFDWQLRFEFIAKGLPNIICSTFAGNALLDGYELTTEPEWLGAARSVADFILDVLFSREGGSKACFSYTLVGRDEIHNVNLLGAAFLCRVGRISGDNKKYLGPAFDPARYSVGRQPGDGSWDYGEAPTQHWIDNFHTGFNPVALRRIGEYGGTTEFESSIRRGFDFFKAHFFREDGAPRYDHDSTYPIDIHSAAQSLITLAEYRDFGGENIDLAHSVLRWTLANMWDPRGLLYFQQHPHFLARTSFMRWTQARMPLALATFLSSPHWNR